MSTLRFCHERGQNKRWGAARHVKRSGISIRVYSILTNIVKKSKSSQHLKNICENVEQSWKSWFFKKINFLGVCPKMCFRECGLFRANSDPKSIILMRDSPLGLITLVYILINPSLIPMKSLPIDPCWEPSY